MFTLSNSFYIQISHVEGTDFFDVDSVDSHKSVGYFLAAIGGDRVDHAVGDHINRHAFLYPSSTGELGILYCDSEYRHRLIMRFVAVQSSRVGG